MPHVLVPWTKAASAGPLRIEAMTDSETIERIYALAIHAVKKADDALSVAEKALNEVELIKQDMTLEYWKIGSN